MIRKRFIALILSFAVVLSYIGVAAATNTTASAQSAAPLLPGEATMANGVPAYVFGFNNGIEYGTPNFSTLPAVQAQVKAAGLTIDRIWAPYDGATGLMSSSDITDFTNHINGANNSGAACYVELGEVDNLPLLKQEVQFAEPKGCHMFEFGNEFDTAHSSTSSQYSQQWNTDIPQLRALSVCAGTATVTTGCLFGGPATPYPVANDSGASNDGNLACVTNSSTKLNNSPHGQSMIGEWMCRLNPTTAFPNFVSWHQYPCNGAGGNGGNSGWNGSQAADKAACIADASSTAATCGGSCNASLGYSQQYVLDEEQYFWGKVIPTGISETNFDPGSGTLNLWATDDTFMSQYETAILNAFAANHFSFAMTYTSLDWAGYGDLDMFSDAAPYAPKAQFLAMAAAVKKYNLPSTYVGIPKNGATEIGDSWLDAGAFGGVTSVNFELSGVTVTDKIISGSTRTIWGWIGAWNSASVPNGTYTLQSVACTASAVCVTSAPITVTVNK